MAGQNERHRYDKAGYNRLFKASCYTRQTVHRDREYGLFWYDWLWQVLRRVLSVVCALLVVAGLFSTAWKRLYTSLIAPTAAGEVTTYAFTVNSGESVSTIGRRLEEVGFIQSDSMFKYYVQFKGLTNKLQSGVYDLSHGMDLFEVANVLSSGKGTNERTIRIIPGWNVEDIAEYLVNVGAISKKSEFLDECRRYQNYMGYSLALINAAEHADLSARTYPLEGYLAPDTYRIYLTADAASIVHTLVRQMDTVYTSMFSREATYDENGNKISDPEPIGANGVTLTDDEVFILASIIEKEASAPGDMKRVSAVFYNRLALGMKLESDPTVKYLTGITRLALTSNDLARRTSYNTYLVSGLPVGPICSPSRNALLAAMEPDQEFLDNDFLFFCAAEPGSGALAFARTGEEHQRNVDKYRPLWEAYDREQAAKRQQSGNQ
ncbi:MAG: endolytic transglycosylase MltG [Clostridia bacterium]|nr:endolytic transglycosylase MltG [Clostridia bacterium]